MFVLVDSSATDKTQEIRDVLNQLVVKLKVGDGSNKIALAQFGDTVVKEFLFSDYKDTATVREYINRFEPRPNGDRKLGNAMDYVRTNFLNTAAGSRISKGYRQYVLVLRVGESTDSVLGATRTMKSEDVTVIDMRLETNLRLLTPMIRGYDDQQDILQIAADITKRIETKEVFNVTGGLFVNYLVFLFILLRYISYYILMLTDINTLSLSLNRLQIGPSGRHRVYRRRIGEHHHK